MSSPADQRPVVDARRVATTARNMMAEVESGVDALSTFPEGQQALVSAALMHSPASVFG